LIILDEPTLGLDPNQIRQVRQLIKSLGGTHTVLISTHILPEVEMTCDQVLILHEGRILASDSPHNLQSIPNEGSQVVAELLAPATELAEWCASLPDVLHYDISTSEGDYLRCNFTARAGVDLRPIVYEAARSNDWKLRELTRSQPSLEDVFVHMTRPKIDEEER
ncbi:MAG TPA: ABC transporter ATP-binding protein, partial [Verrucomicrobiota bacterium]|nr:ABC transporter ATP-binding protein [Verrucomicrobiota bacterium]